MSDPSEEEVEGTAWSVPNPLTEMTECEHFKWKIHEQCLKTDKYAEI